MIPQVVASERGGAQTLGVATRRGGSRAAARQREGGAERSGKFGRSG